jgi:hypothetical protein
MLPCCNAFLPLAGSFLPILRRYVYLDWRTPRRRIKGEDIRVLEGRKGQLYVEGVTACQSSQERGILCRERVEVIVKGREEAIEAF